MFGSELLQQSVASIPTVLSTLSLGFVIGVKHAMDADHIVAITTIVSEKKNLWQSSFIGILWGLGHTASLAVFGLVVLLLKTSIPDRLALGLEFAVGVMLLFLGSNLLYKMISGQKLHSHVHEHDGHKHAHFHFHRPQEAEAPHTHHGFKHSRKPFWVGIVHGMAGSATLMLLILASIESTWLAIAYIAIFGVGSIGGMMLLSAMICLPFSFTADKFPNLHNIVRAAAGTLSIAFGIILMYQIGFVEGLFGF